MPDFRAQVYVTLKRSILDPQGRTVEGTLGRLGHDNVSDVRVGKYIELTLSGERDEVEAQVRESGARRPQQPGHGGRAGGASRCRRSRVDETGGSLE